jgi:L-iditol 2-dehydrogenase
MIAAVFHGPGEMQATELDVPDIGPDEVLMKVGANTLCGTDGRILRGEKTKGVRRPSILGHEFAGHVAQVGQQVRGFEVGMPVAMAPVVPCRRCFYCQHDMENACLNRKAMGYEFDGGLSEYVRIPSVAIEAGNLFAAREDLPSEFLALAEPLSCCVNGHRRSRVGIDSTVLILGGGPIGIFHLQLSLLAGAGVVIVSEPSRFRRDFASRLGAHVVVDPSVEDLPSIVAEATGGLGVDSTIICIGLPQLVNEALTMTRKGGRINIFAGLSGQGWAQVESNLIHYNELEVTGTTAARRSDYEVALRLIESGRVDVKSMVTDRFPLQRTSEAISETMSGNEGLKVAVIP